MSTSQINARIDADLKVDGDSAFSAIGYSPTQVIRALWGFASRNRQDTETLRSILNTLEGKDVDKNRTRAADKRAKIAKSGPQIIEEALKEVGATAAETDYASLSYDELLDRAYLDKWKERELV